MVGCFNADRARSTLLDGGGEATKCVAQFRVIDAFQFAGLLCGLFRIDTHGRRTSASAISERRLSQCNASDSAPTEKPVYPVDNHSGKMLDLDGRGPFRPKNERRRLRRVVVDRSRPLHLERLGEGRDILPYDIRPMRDQLRRREALLGEYIAQTAAHKVGKRPRERSGRLVHSNGLWQSKA